MPNPQIKVTHVSMRPTEQAVSMGRPSLTPELLAATGARYSRTNDGLEAILAKIDPTNLDKSVDSIFKMVDYGHQSIADMVPVALFIDNVSIFLAYIIWSLCPTAGGQESSTRYIKMSAEGVIDPELLGIPAEKQATWNQYIKESFDSYQAALDLWESSIQRHPELIGLSPSIFQDESDFGRKKLARLKRNYGFDRSRYFLPVAAATNMMLVMSARGWVSLCQYLCSSPLREAVALGQAITKEMELVAPRMIKHAIFKLDSAQGQKSEFEAYVKMAEDSSDFGIFANGTPVREVGPMLEIYAPNDTDTLGDCFAKDLAQHNNRYAWIGTTIQRTAVRFGWKAVSFAEIRDLNRHRTGTKYCPLVPRGFYYAEDQISKLPTDQANAQSRLQAIARSSAAFVTQSLDLLRSADPTYVYWTNLGTQYRFEHLTTADKFIYEAELRTGLGSHFRYASHLKDVLALLYSRLPETKGLIIEGSAEPED